MLYIVATPIGNLDEMTFRAVEVLKNVNLIAAEDTRHTALLLERYGIRTATTAYHKFNEKKACGELIERLKEGEDIAVVSDAGMPTVSDPGHILIDAAVENGIEFTVVSGACAAIDALVLSGLDTRRFAVLGFLPEKKTDRRRFIEPFVSLPSTLVFYSSVHDIKDDLAFLYETLGARRVTVCREMTKKFETVVRGNLGDELEIVEKGEFAVVVEGANPAAEYSSMSVEDHIRQYLDQGVDLKDAIKKVAFERRVAKSEVYKAALGMKERGEIK